MARPRIAWFSPLQPIESGISLYSEDILPVLGSVADIDVFADGYRPAIISDGNGLRIRDQRSLQPGEYDLIVYQIGNSPAHLSALPEVTRTPGLLVLHDTVLNHLFVQQAAREGTLTEYRDTMHRRYGADGLRAAERVLKGQAPDDLFRFPMSEQLVRRSRATLVHSEYARQQVLRWEPGATVYCVPHGLKIPEYVDRTTARELLGLPVDQFLVASITHINPYKRIDVVLRALKALRTRVPARLLLAGSVSPNYPLTRMIAHLGLDQVVDVYGYVEDREARLIAAAADVIVNLRYPTAGETSGSLLHSMAAGRPVLVSSTGSFTEVPKDAAIRIPVDALEEPMLLSTLRRLAKDQRLRDEIGIRARDFVQTQHSMQRWVDGYVDAINELTGARIRYADIDAPEEPVITRSLRGGPRRFDEFTSSIARIIAELGVGGDDRMLESLATDCVELGLEVGMINRETESTIDDAGGSHDGSGK